MSAGLASMPSHAVVFTELGDAGQTQATAQVGAGTPGALTNILGSLLTTTDADLYIIDIADPGVFSATTENAGTGDLDTELFLLTLTGAPIFLNDDGAFSLGSTLPEGSFGSLAAGRYLLGVALSGYEPININGQLLFDFDTNANGLRGPKTGLQPAFLGDFTGDGLGVAGAYDIQLTGVAAIPEPATNALLLAGGALLAFVARRRRGVVTGTAA